MAPPLGYTVIIVVLLFTNAYFYWSSSRAADCQNRGLTLITRSVGHNLSGIPTAPRAIYSGAGKYAALPGYQWEVNAEVSTIEISSLIKRVDTFHFYDDNKQFFRAVHFAWWSSWCDAHIVDSPDASRRFFNGWRSWGRHVRPNSISVDIGTHMGDTTIPIALHSSMTLAYEPHPDLFGVMKTQASLNPDLNIFPFNFAIAEKAGTSKFFYGGNCNGGAINNAGTDSTVLVNTVNFFEHIKQQPWFSEALIPRISFIKIDAEGFDGSILLTMKPFLAAYKRRSDLPTFHIEWFAHFSESQTATMFENIKAIGYRPYHPTTDLPIDYTGGARLASDLILRPE